MSESVEQLLLSLLKRQSDQATSERRELRESFETNLRAIRNEFRVFALLVVGGLLALLGVGTTIHVPGMSIQTAPTSSGGLVTITTSGDPEHIMDAAPPADIIPASELHADDPRSDAEHAPLEP